MRYITFIIICLYTYALSADNRGKLLPIKISSNNRVTTYTYDKSNKVKSSKSKYIETEDTLSNNTYIVTKFSYTKDGFFKRHINKVYNSDEELKKGKVFEEYSGGTFISLKNDTLCNLISWYTITASKGRKMEVMPSESNISISLDTDGKPVSMTIIDDEDKMLYDSLVFDYTYNIDKNITKYIKTRYYSNANLPPIDKINKTDVTLKYDTRNGIFKDVNNNRIQDAANRPFIFFLWNDCNILEKTEKSGKNIKTTEYKYTYNAEGYPISYITILDGEVVENVYIEYQQAN